MIAQYIAAGILDLLGLLVVAAAVAAWALRIRERRQLRAYRTWRRAQARRRATAASAPMEHQGATEDWSPLADVEQQETAPELLLVQTTAEKAAEVEQMARPIPDDVGARIDAALAGIRAACDRGRDAILAGDAMARTRAYYQLADLHRHPDHTPGETASMQIRAELDARLAADDLTGATR
jgi:hypothetical protein